MASPVPPPSRPPIDDLTDRLLGGRYRLVGRIASGGMAQVWEGVDEVLARRVAVKILHAHLAADSLFVTRFRAEAISAARLAHPSIVSIYDTISDGGLEAIVMELVRGRTLRARLDEKGPLEMSDVVGIGAQVTDALGVAHRNGVVHRDVKPANILLSDDGRVLVADFGIAKAAEQADLTHDGIMVGTAKYVAPEQVSGGPVDGRTDLYSLGVVLYEALCGRPPFEADGEAATALARLQRDPLRPRQVRAGIPRPLEDVVLRALERDPARRFPDAAAMRSALVAAGDQSERVGRPRSVVARAPTPAPAPRPGRQPRHPSGTWRSRPVAYLLAAMAGIAAIGLLLGATSPGRDLLGRMRDVAGGGTAGNVKPLSLTSARAFDPFSSDHRENDALAPRAIDGDHSSSWSTEHYNDPDIGRIKPGVGLIVSLDKAADLRRVVVSSPTSGWSASVYLAGGRVPDTLQKWGRPVATRRDIPVGDTAFDLGGRSGDALLVWITHTGTDGRARIADVRVEGSR